VPSSRFSWVADSGDLKLRRSPSGMFSNAMGAGASLTSKEAWSHPDGSDSELGERSHRRMDRRGECKRRPRLPTSDVFANRISREYGLSQAHHEAADNAVPSLSNSCPKIRRVEGCRRVPCAWRVGRTLPMLQPRGRSLEMIFLERPQRSRSQMFTHSP